MSDELVPRPAQGRVFEARRRVRLADSSVGGRLQLDAIARYLQDIANDDAREAESPNFTAWVARRTVLQVSAFPRYLDLVSMATWCSGIGSRWAERRSSMIADEPSGGCVEAATLWVHIDLQTMRPIPLPAGFAEQFGAAALGRTVSARQVLAARAPADERAHRSLWPARAVDFDVLGHMNNSVYWAMVEEQLARRRGLRAPLTVLLEHRDAIDPDVEIKITTIDDADGIDMWIESEGRVAAVVAARRLTPTDDR